ncbi:tetratricopeptide repeat protein [Halobacteriovorax sp. RT-1-4]|uniref:tetratricopeptide repeat protein n=1 Tax=unclassified Halobacteriovorax TaxID=2639665 RepID=UPI00399B9938
MVIEAIALKKAAGTFTGKGLVLLFKYITTENIDLDKLLREAIASAQRKICETKEVIEIDVNDFLSEIRKIAQGWDQVEDSKVSFIKKLESVIFDEGLIYHSNETTRRHYSDYFAQHFCYYLRINLIESPQFSAVITASHQLNTETSFETIIGNQEAESSKMDIVLEKLIKLERLAGKEGGTISALTSSPLNSNEPYFTGGDLDEVADEAVIVEKIEELEKLRADKNINEGTSKGKFLLPKVQQKSEALLDKVLCLTLSLYITGDQSDWENGIQYYEQELDEKVKTTYSRVLYSALLTNLSQLDKADHVLNSLKHTETFVLSNDRKDVLCHIKAIIQLNRNNISEAKKIIEECRNKEVEEYKYIKLLAHKGEVDDKVLELAFQVINDKSSDLRLVGSATDYILSYFQEKTKKNGDPFKTLGKSRLYIEVSYNALKSKLENVTNFKKVDAKVAIICFVNCGYLLKKRNEIIPLAKLAIAKGVKEPQLIINTAQCCFFENDFVETLNLFKLLDFETIVKFEGFFTLIGAAEKTNDLDYLYEFEKQVELIGLDVEQKDKVLAHLWEVTKDNDFLLDNYNKLEKRYPGSTWIYLIHAEKLSSAEDLEKAKSIYEKGIAINPIDVALKVSYARFALYDLKDFLLAESIYEKIIVRDSPKSEIYNYLNTLYELKKYNEIIKKVDSWDPEEDVGKFQAFKAYALLYLGDLDACLLLLEKIVNDNPNEKQFLHNYITALYKKGDIEKLLDIHDRYINLSPEDYEARIRFSQLLMSKGKYEKALMQAKVAAKQAFTVAEAQFNFFLVFQTVSQKEPNNLVICSEENITFYQDIMKNFNNRFPESNLLRPMRVVDEEGNLEIDKIKAMLKEQSEYCDQILDIYKNKNMPVSYLSVALGRNMYEMWSFLLGNGGLRADFADQKRIKEELHHLNEYDPNMDILIDSTALISFASANILSKVQGSSLNFAVTTSTKAELVSSKEKLKMSHGEIMTIAYHNGQMLREEITQEQVNSAINVIDEILSFIDSCKIIPVDLNSRTRQIEVQNVVTQEYLEIFDIVERKAISLLSFDGNFRMFLTLKKLPSVGVQAILLYLEQCEAISYKDFNSALIYFLLLNYKGITYSTIIVRDYLLNDHDDKRKELLLNRILEGSDFNSQDSLTIFIAELFAELSLKGETSFNEVIAQSIKAGSSSDQQIRIFAIRVYFVYLGSEAYTGNAKNLDKSFDSLNLELSSGIKIASSVPKEWLHQIHEDELNKQREEFGKRLNNKPNN